MNFEENSKRTYGCSGCNKANGVEVEAGINLKAKHKRTLYTIYVILFQLEIFNFLSSYNGRPDGFHGIISRSSWSKTLIASMI